MSPPVALTHLQLARMVADAVLVAAAAGLQSPDDTEDAPTQAVLAVLRDTGTTFCRVLHEGLANGEAPPPMPDPEAAKPRKRKRTEEA